MPRGIVPALRGPLAPRVDRRRGRSRTLAVRDLVVRFGGVTALAGVSFAVRPGGVTSLIGPNGAGKTTAFNVITGFQRPTSGRVAWDGRDVTGWRPCRIAALGLVRTFQKTSVFPALPVLENVLTGLHLRGRTGLAAALLRRRRVAVEERALRDEALAVLDFVGLGARRDEAGGRPLLRRAAAGGAGGGHGRAPAPAAPRRARLRHDAGGEGGDGGPHPEDLRDRRHRAAGGARHAPGDGHLGPRARPEPRPAHRRRPARGGAAGPRGDPRLPRHRAMLRLESVSAGYGRVGVLAGVSLEVRRGDFVCLVGANGAGKTTTLKTISGLLRPSAGRIVFDGQDIGGRKPQDILRLRHRPLSRGPAGVPVSDRAGEPRHGRLCAAGRGRGGRGPRAGAGALPRPGRAPAPGGGHAVGRRAADAGHRAGADGAARGSSCSTSRRWGWRPP